MKKAFAIARYAWKMLTMPAGTTYELKHQPVNRFTYTYHTARMLLALR